MTKARNQWFAIYLDHYKKKLDIEILFYDAYLLIIKNKSINFGITRLQTNNILNIRIEAFINKKKTEIIEGKFKTKSQTILETSILKDFNSCHITIKDESIIIIQKK